MASIQDSRFIFNNISSGEFGVLLCRFSTDSSYSSNDEEAEITTSKTYGSDYFHLVNVDYVNPLKFTITLCKEDGTYFDSYEQRNIKKWLCRNNEYHWLYIDQTDLSDIGYECAITFSEMVDIGGRNGGMKFNVQCSSPFPHSRETTKTYTCSSNTLSFNFYYDSDFAEYDKVLYPTVQITSSTNGIIQITNNTTGEYMKFKDCVVGEIITVTSDEIPSTTSNNVIIDRWNYTSLYFVDGLNSISISGNCTLKLTYSCPRRVGG
jgi:hypothetical protein